MGEDSRGIQISKLALYSCIVAVFLWPFVQLQAAESLTQSQYSIISPNSLFKNEGSSLAWNFSSYFRSNQNYFRSGAESELTDLDLHLKGSITPLRLTYNLRDTYRIGENFNYIKPYELYVNAYQSPNVDINVGRKLLSWSRADSYWMQGLWQPRFLDDRFVTEQAGLTGVFLEKKWSMGKSSFWATPLHVPETGPDFSIEEQQFVSGSPWFKTPPSTVIIRGQATKVHYRVNKPELEEIVVNPGVGFNWQSEDAEVRRYLSRLSLAYKPMEQLLLGFPFFLELSETEDSSSLNVEVNPRVIYHRIATWETENVISTPQLKTALRTSLTFESPERDSTPEPWITQEVSDAFIASVWAVTPVGRGLVDVGWLHVWGGDEPDKGEFAPEGTLFERRYQYLHAVRLGGESGSYYAGGWTLKGGSRFIYDFEQAGLTWTNELVAMPTEDLSLHVRADIIGLTGDEEKIANGFIRTYRANDRVQAGVKYVF